MRLPDLELGRRKILKDCTVKRHRLVAILFNKNGYIISIETNRRGSGQISDWSWHAEEFIAYKLAKINAKRRYGKLAVLVARLGRKRDDWTLAKPCNGCAQKLVASGVDEIFYTDDNGKIVELK